MTITDLGAQVRGWALDEAAKAGLGEDFGVDVAWSPQAAQTPQGVQMMPVWSLLITTRSPLLGQPALYHLVPVFTETAVVPVPAEAQVRAEVCSGITQLRDLAARMLAGANGGSRPGV